ncbi:MAG: aldehyde dehydrogenase family protein, partial [Acidimicrobiales bacterium]|nr:aldehyde dehydrogenase family protein [Acidimicrobiales bacterium]
MSEQLSIRIGDSKVQTPQSMTVVSPYDGHEFAKVPRCGPEHVEMAVAEAKRCLATALPAWKRAEILDSAALAMQRHRERLAQTIAREAAKPIRTARGEAERAVLTFQAAAVEARTLAGEMIPIEGASPGEGKLAFTMRVPRGVVGAISPFNFPLNLVVHKVAPAIAAGCPVVLKPASQTPISAIFLQEILMDECGLPPGWFNIVTGPGASVGDPLVDHPDVAVITFTGSPEVGWAIASRAATKKVGLELGNNAPVIIDASGDWRTASAKIALAGFSHAGQSCISTQRIYVHSSVAEEFSTDLVQRVNSLVVGDPMDENTDVSALISTSEAARVKSWVDDAQNAGAKLLAGGELVDGVMMPTVLSQVTP